jgi:hypothetical protein
VIKNDLRAAIGDLRCADLVASCALVQNTPAPAACGARPEQDRRGQREPGQDRAGHLQLPAEGHDQTRCGPATSTFKRFNLIKVDLPSGVQQAIEDTQKQFASVSQATGDAEAPVDPVRDEAQAGADRRADQRDREAEGLPQLPDVRQIDKTKALPQGITVYAPGNGNVAVPAK